MDLGPSIDLSNVWQFEGWGLGFTIAYSTPDPIHWFNHDLGYGELSQCQALLEVDLSGYMVNLWQSTTYCHHLTSFAGYGNVPLQKKLYQGFRNSNHPIGDASHTLLINSHTLPIHVIPHQQSSISSWFGMLVTFPIPLPINIPSGKLTVCYRKSACLLWRSTINDNVQQLCSITRGKYYHSYVNPPYHGWTLSIDYPYITHRLSIDYPHITHNAVKTIINYRIWEW